MALLLTVSLFNACDENIELDPISQLDGANGFQTKQDVDAALIGCYGALTNGNYMGLRYFALPDLYADILTHTGTFPSWAQFANRNLLTDNAELRLMWQQVYIAINRTNNVIAAAPGVNDPSFNATNAVAEARFLRAYSYLNLLLGFGGSPTGYNQANGVGVPLITTPTITAKDAEPKNRATEAEVWTQILEDVNFAVQNLAANNGVGRANKRIATALKARIHMYRGEWALAETAANEIITTGGYTLVPTNNYANIWLTKNSTETIWELQFDANNTNSIAFFYYPTTLGGRNEIASTTSLRDAHEMGDVRRDVNFTPSNPTAKTRKFTRVAGEDNVQLIRLAEMYLIRAEAAARLNKGSAALADMNIIRRRAGLTDFTSTDATAILNAIEKERRLELAHEGFRWFDLRRLNKIATAGITQEFRALWPIPQREIDTSAKVIAQNTGY